MADTLGIFVRQPVAGQVKTRLAVQLGAQGAAELNAAFIADLIDRFRATVERRCLCITPATNEAMNYFEAMAGGDYGLWPQPDGDLGTRLQSFFEEHIAGLDDRAVVIGSDSPTLPREYVERAFEQLKSADCVVGPATDGGYYLAGMRGRMWPVFSGISWSTSRVLEETVQRIADCGARLAVLPVWYDVDTPDDLQMLDGHVRALAAAGSPVNLGATRRALGLDTANPKKCV